MTINARRQWKIRVHAPAQYQPNVQNPVVQPAALYGDQPEDGGIHPVDENGRPQPRGHVARINAEHDNNDPVVQRLF